MADVEEVQVVAPSWQTLPEGARLLASGATVRVAWRVALVVGTVLSAVNQGHLLLDGDVATGTRVRIAVNYLVPFVVASIGFLSACRQR